MYWAISIFSLALLIQGAHAQIVIPALEDEWLVNDATKECALKQVRECGECFLREGWKSIGLKSLVDCPTGYNVLDSGSKSSYCVAIRSEQCCTSNPDIPGGDCEYIVFNEAEQLCTFSLCKKLPSGWSRTPPAGSDGKCPLEWSWIDANTLGCASDPCQTKTTCGKCIDVDCIWSVNDINDETCSPVCEGGASTCLKTPTSDLGLSADELCDETGAIIKDNIECESKLACGECKNDSKCRWVDSCSDEQSCEECFATSCSDLCAEVDTCPDVPTEESSTTTTTTTSTKRGKKKKSTKPGSKVRV